MKDTNLRSRLIRSLPSGGSVAEDIQDVHGFYNCVSYLLSLSKSKCLVSYSLLIGSEFFIMDFFCNVYVFIISLLDFLVDILIIF